MSTVLEVQSDGRIFVVKGCPEKPDLCYHYKPDNTHDCEHSYNAVCECNYRDFNYHQALASCERILCADQEQAKKLLWAPDELPLGGWACFKPHPGLYQVPVEYEVVDNTYIYEGTGKYWEDKPVKMKRLLNLPEQYAILKESKQQSEDIDVTQKESQEKLLYDLLLGYERMRCEGRTIGSIVTDFTKQFTITRNSDNK